MMRAGRQRSIVRRGSLIGTACSLLGIWCVACGVSPRPHDVVVYASGTDLESANPLVTTHPLSRQVQRYALFVTLARFDSTLAPVPYAAISWQWSSDRHDLVFVLAPDLRWHDGTPTSALDVAFTLLAARDPETGYARAADLVALDTVEALDASTVALRFRVAQSTFPLVLCELPILPSHLLQSVPRSDLRRAAFNLSPVGNGPFRFVRRVAGQLWEFERNLSFPRLLGGPPKIARLVVAVVDEPTTKFAGLASGDLDFAGIAPAMASLAARDPMMRVVDYPVLFSTALLFNVHRPPFDDPRVRRAIDLSINRTRLVDAALAGYGRPATGPVVPENPYALPRTMERDTHVADSLLAAAGWERPGNGFRRRNGRTFTVELLTVGSGDHAIEQLVQADLAERGIRLEIRDLEFGAFIAQARAVPKTYDLLLTGIPGDVSLAYLGAMYDGRQRGSALDYGDFHTSELDSLFVRAQNAATRAEATMIWQWIQAVLARDLPAVWLYHSRGLQGVSSRMRGVRMDVRGELVSVRDWSVAERSQ
jgi:peptide/nickel transport system substrate-binding protein